MNNLKQRIQSDRAASVSVETIIIIALAVFAGLALFTFVLKPVQESSDSLGSGIKKFTGDLMNSQGKGTPSFEGGLGTGGMGTAPGGGN